MAFVCEFIIIRFKHKKIKPKIKCTTFWKVYIIILNTKRLKMHVTIACVYGGFKFLSLSTSSFISIFPSSIYLFIPIFIFCPLSFLLNMLWGGSLILGTMEAEWKKIVLFVEL